MKVGRRRTRSDTQASGIQDHVNIGVIWQKIDDGGTFYVRK